MKKLWCITLTSLLLSCTSTSEDFLNEISIKKYSFTFPNSFHKKVFSTFNSYVGQIKNDSITFSFELSNHTVPPIKNIADYLSADDWMPGVELDIVTKRNIPIGETIIYSRPRISTKKDSSAGIYGDYITTCKTSNSEFDMPILLPPKMKGISFTTDTISNHHREIFTAEDPKNGITGLFLKPLDFDKQTNIYSECLSITITNITKKQQAEVLKILSSLKITSSK